MEGYDYDQDDLNNAILCVWKEARGDGHAAMNAVAHVIFNRIGAPGFCKHSTRSDLREEPILVDEHQHGSRV
jgi:hypothetical protein